MKILKINNGNLEIRDKVEGFFLKIVTRYGNGAKVDVPKKYLGRSAYIIVK